MLGFSRKQLLILAVALVLVIRFRAQIGGLLSKVPVVNKIAGVEAA